jgi:hypothetical protein
MSRQLEPHEQGEKSLADADRSCLGPEKLAPDMGSDCPEFDGAMCGHSRPDQCRPMGTLSPPGRVSPYPAHPRSETVSHIRQLCSIGLLLVIGCVAES